MKNLIYQYWDDSNPDCSGNNAPGRVNLPGVNASKKSIKTYADRIGADHLFEYNPPYLHDRRFAVYYGAFNPIWRDEFLEYDNVLFLDADIHAVDGLDESIFDGFDADIGLCTEPLQPKLRAATKVGMVNRHQNELWAGSCEERWGMTIPRTDDGLLEVYNGGVVLYSNEGMRNARKDFMPFEEYVDHVLSIKGCLPYFAADQEYLQVALHAARTNFVRLDNSWNVLVTLHERDDKRVIFDRTPDTKFVHPMGLVGVHHYSEEQLWKLTNLPVEEWGVGKRNVVDDVR